MKQNDYFPTNKTLITVSVEQLMQETCQFCLYIHTIKEDTYL